MNIIQAMLHQDYNTLAQSINTNSFIEYNRDRTPRHSLSPFLWNIQHPWEEATPLLFQYGMDSVFFDIHIAQKENTFPSLLMESAKHADLSFIKMWYAQTKFPLSYKDYSGRTALHLLMESIRPESLSPPPSPSILHACIDWFQEQGCSIHTPYPGELYFSEKRPQKSGSAFWWYFFATGNYTSGARYLLELLENNMGYSSETPTPPQWERIIHLYHKYSEKLDLNLWTRIFVSGVASEPILFQQHLEIITLTWNVLSQDTKDFLFSLWAEPLDNQRTGFHSILGLYNTSCFFDTLNVSMNTSFDSLLTKDIYGERPIDVALFSISRTDDLYLTPETLPLQNIQTLLDFISIPDNQSDIMDASTIQEAIKNLTILHQKAYA